MEQLELLFLEIEAVVSFKMIEKNIQSSIKLPEISGRYLKKVSLDGIKKKYLC